MLALLEGTEAAIRPLILEKPAMERLWRGPYPTEVAKLLAAQYRSMDIARVTESPDRVALRSTAAPMPVELVLEGQAWKVDPSPIIEFRADARSSQNRTVTPADTPKLSPDLPVVANS